MAHVELTVPSSITGAHGSITSSIERILREGANTTNYLSSLGGLVVDSLAAETELAAGELSTFTEETGVVSQRSTFFLGRIQEEVDAYNQRAEAYLDEPGNDTLDLTFQDAQQTANDILADIGAIMQGVAGSLVSAINPFQSPSASGPGGAVAADLLNTVTLASRDASAALTPGPQAALTSLGTTPTGNSEVDQLAGPLSQGVKPIEVVKQKTSNQTTTDRIAAARSAAQSGTSTAQNGQSSLNNQIPPLLNDLAGLL